VILDEILAAKAGEVARRREARPLSTLEAALADAPPHRPVATALRAPGLSVIAEIKRRSPSGGELRPGASAVDLARTYAEHGAAALSVLTDTPYFGGTDQDLVDARSATTLPALRKDFVVDPYQVYEARALGADAILLVVRALDQAELDRLYRLATELGLEVLVETHAADEVRRAVDVGATIIGVNNRDLDRLVTDPSLALRLRDLVPRDRVYVAESGVSQPDQLRALASANADAALIGEALVSAPDPGTRLRSLLDAAAVPSAGAVT
jgi:indole-3-glycerol phosphate synthase